MRPNGVEQRNDQGFPQVVDEMSHVTQGNAQLFNTARLWGNTVQGRGYYTKIENKERQ